MGVATAYLRDDFTDNSQAAAWGASFVSGSATKAETGGQAVLTLPSSTAGTHSAYYRTSGIYNLTGDSFYWNIGTMVATGVAATATFDLYDTIDPTNVLRWQQLSNAITARKIIAGTDTQLYTATWSGTTYKYLRIRETGGNIEFHSSTNGTSWTLRATITGLPFDISQMAIQFGASCGNVASPGQLKLDDVNLILPALTTTWRWTQVEWSLLYRFRSITLAVSSGQGYVATSPDGTTWTYFSGPIGSSSGGYNALTQQSTQAAAEAMAVTMPADDRWDLPTIVECRFIRLYHRSTTGSSYTIREFYPRRLVQSDDIEAESISAINMSAHFITADQIATINLDATAKITWAGGVGVLDDVGARITAHNLLVEEISHGYTFRDGSTEMGGLYGGASGSGVGVLIKALQVTSKSSTVRIRSNSVSGQDAIILLDAQSASGQIASLTFNSLAGGSSTSFRFSDNLATVFIEAGLNVGSATGAGAGQISTSGSVGVGVAVASNVRLYAKGTDTTSSNYALLAADSAGTSLLWARNDGYVMLAKSGGSIGFFAAAAATKQTVTGSRGGNAALASLLSALATYGLVTDSSSA